MGSVYLRLFFYIISENWIMEGVLDLHFMCFDWMHYVAWLIWSQIKIVIIYFERKAGSEVKRITDFDLFSTCLPN